MFTYNVVGLIYLPTPCLKAVGFTSPACSSLLLRGLFFSASSFACRLSSSCLSLASYRDTVNSRHLKVLISKGTLFYKTISFGHISCFYFHLNSCYLFSVCQSILSGTKKFTLRYQYFGMNFNSEISRFDCIYIYILSYTV